MQRPVGTFWLASPSRFAALSRRHARLAIAAAVALIALCLLALVVADPTAPAPASAAAAAPAEHHTDLALYDEIVAGMRAGGSYYDVAADAMRTGGYPLRPFFTMRLPALATVEASLPPWAVIGLLFALAAATALAWAVRLREALPGTLPRIAAALLLFGSILAFVQPNLAAFHEIWAALLVALSLAMRRPGRWIEAVALALMAMLIRETAALYVLVMAACAIGEGARREAAGWIAALLLFALALAAHGYAVGGVTGPSDAASPGWSGLHGPGLFVRAITVSTALQLLPIGLAAPLVGLALFGWASWRSPLALRMLLVVLAYAVLIAVFARTDTFYWGLMIAPVFLVGLVFVPDGLRDLASRALDRRQIRVQRIAQ